MRRVGGSSVAADLSLVNFCPGRVSKRERERISVKPISEYRLCVSLNHALRIGAC